MEKMKQPSLQVLNDAFHESHEGNRDEVTCGIETRFNDFAFRDFVETGLRGDVVLVAKCILCVFSTGLSSNMYTIVHSYNQLVFQ